MISLPTGCFGFTQESAPILQWEKKRKRMYSKYLSLRNRPRASKASLNSLQSEKYLLVVYVQCPVGAFQQIWSTLLFEYWEEEKRQQINILITNHVKRDVSGKFAPVPRVEDDFVDVFNFLEIKPNWLWHRQSLTVTPASRAPQTELLESVLSETCNI